MADSDQAIRDIVAQLVSNGQTPEAAAAPATMGVMPAPEVTPTMVQGTAGAPLVIAPTLPKAAAQGDAWAPDAPVMTVPAVTPLAARPRMATMGAVLGR